MTQLQRNRAHDGGPSVMMPKLDSAGMKMPSAQLAGLERMHESGVRCLESGDADGLFTHLLDTVIEVVHADGGSVHCVDPLSGRLRAVGSRPIADGCLSPPAAVHEAVLDRRERLLVEDVRAWAARDESERGAILGAGILSFQTMPVSALRGEPLGVLSTYWRTPYCPGEVELRQSDVLARQAADFLSAHRATRLLEARCLREERARARAESANRSKDEFLARLSHELRQPLAAVLPALEVQKRSLSPERRQRAAEVVGQQLQQLSRLIEDLSDLARINRGALDLRRERLDLRDIVEQALEMVRPQLEEKQHVTTVHLGSDAAWVHADLARMKQVFSNLLQNSAAYTPPRGRIHISVVHDEGPLQVRLRDNGVGIHADELDRIFEPFERGSRVLDTPHAGIGLSVVRQIVELHGGTVTVASDGPGHGSEFTVTMPSG